MKELLNIIGSADLKNIQQLDKLCDIVRQYYANNERHKYSEVSAYLMESADIDYLLENLQRIQDRLKEFPNDQKVSIKVFKLIDHITLELNRTKYNAKNYTDMQISAMNTVLNQATKEIVKAADELRIEQSQKINTEIEEFRVETSDLKDKVEDSYSQFVAILGIFSAIVVVFFGGMTAFSSLFANLQNIIRFKLIFVASLVGMIIFNLIFMFLYVLAKLLKRDIAASTAETITGRFSVINWIVYVWAKYPYVLMFNTIMSILMIGSFITWYGFMYFGWKI